MSTTTAEGVEQVAATPAAPAEPTQQFQSFAEEQKSWTPEERAEWDRSEKTPDRTATPATTEVSTPQQPAPEKAKDEPIASVGEEDQDHEPEYFGTPEQVSKQRHAFQKEKRRRIAAEAENKVLREQRAERPQAVTAAAPKADSNPVDGEPDLNLPDITKYPDSAEGVNQWQKDTAAEYKRYSRAMADFDRKQSSVQSERQQRAQSWESEVEAIKSQHGEAAVQAIYALPVSHTMMGVLTGMKDGGKVYHYFASNPEAAQALAVETNFPEFQNYAELAKAAESNPTLARQLGAAEALVKAEAKRILSGSAVSTKVPDPKPITVSDAPPPAEKVTSATAVSKDALSEAEAMYDKTGEHKYLTLMNKLQDERDAAARKARPRGRF